MKKGMAMLLAAAMLLTGAVICAAAEGNSLAEQVEDRLHASIQHEKESPEWVGELAAAQDETVTQLFVVAGMGLDKTTATVSMHERDENGQWKQILSTPGYVGKYGLCRDEDRFEGCGQTPMGIYHFNKAFGIAPDPGCAIPYTQVTDDIWWSGDTREGMRYNEMVDIREYPDLMLDDSEHIVDYEYQYQYCMNISFNEDGTPGRGSAIFLHCLGPEKPYTGGCVAIPENIMKQVMQRAKPDCVVIIDRMENICPDVWRDWGFASGVSSGSAADEAAVRRQDGERFEAVIVLEGMEETVPYEHIRNEALGFEMDYDYERFVRYTDADRECFVSVWDDSANPENYLELTYSPENADAVAASVRKALSQTYDLLEGSRELDRAGSCFYIEASVLKGTNNMADQLQLVYIIPTSDGCIVAAEHLYTVESEGFGRRFHNMLNTLAAIERTGE